MEGRAHIARRRMTEMSRTATVRRKTRLTQVGSVHVGGEAPISVQTMWKAPLERPVEPCIKTIQMLAGLGCDIIRFAVPKLEEADSVGAVAAGAAMPVVADIHFDYRIALRCLDWPIAKIRINPGNIGASWKVEEVVRKARDKGVPIRVGVNGGSLPREDRTLSDVGRAMVAAAERELAVLEKLDFQAVIFSLKSSDIGATIRANEIFSERHPYPLHLGLTEAGPLLPGVVRSSIALSALLRQGIGDTIRVSLSDSPESEVRAGREILKACGLASGGVQIVSCPTCGRIDFDVRWFLEQVEPFLSGIRRDLTVAVMGCPVNGPGEARHADIGITGSEKYAVIFREGKIVRRVPTDMAVEAFKEEILREGT